MSTLQATQFQGLPGDTSSFRGLAGVARSGAAATSRIATARRGATRPILVELALVLALILVIAYFAITREKPVKCDPHHLSYPCSIPEGGRP